MTGAALVLFLASSAFAQTMTPVSANRALKTHTSGRDYLVGEFVTIIDNKDWSTTGFEDVNHSLSAFADGWGEGKADASQRSSFTPTAFHADGTTYATAVQGGISTDGFGEGASSYSATFNLSSASDIRLAGLVRSFNVATQGVLPFAFQLEASIKLYDASNNLLFSVSVTGDNISTPFDQTLSLAGGQYRLDCKAWTDAQALTHDPRPSGNAEFVCDMTVIPAPATIAVLPLLLSTRRRRSVG
jgi:hypothetical protein